MDQIKEILEMRLKRTLEKTSKYFGMGVETSSDGEPIGETAFIRNYSYLLGICSGLQEALKVLEDFDCERS